MTIWWPKSVLIQPRTGLGKSDVSWRDVACAGSLGALGRSTCLELRLDPKCFNDANDTVMLNPQNNWLVKDKTGKMYPGIVVSD